MESQDLVVPSMTPGQETNLISTLAALTEISGRINRLGMGRDLPTTLRLIAENAVAVVSCLAAPAGSQPSAVIWIYDEARQAFDPASRVSAGEPPGASTDDFPRPDGLGRQAIAQRRRLLSYEQKWRAIHPAKQAAGVYSLVCYPLIVSDEIVGLLYVYRCDEGRFSEVELLALDTFVNLAAMAIYHGRQVGGMARALARKVRELETVGLAARLISTRTNLDETLQEILSVGLDITAAQYGSFRLYDKRSNCLTTRALAGRALAQAGPPFSVDERSVVGWVASRRQSLIIPDLHDPQWRDIYQPLPVGREMRSEVAVPLIGTGGSLEGVLNIESPLPDAFSEEDQHLLEALASQAVIPLQEIRLLDALQEIIEVVLTAEIDELLKLILHRACDLSNVPVGTIWTLSQNNTLVVRQATAGQIHASELPLDHSVTGQAIRLRQPLTIEDVRVHPGFQHRDLAIAQGWVSAIVVPLIIPGPAGHVLGGFSLYATQLRDFSDWDKKMLTILANHAALAIHNAEQLAALKQARERQAMAETFAAVGDVAANLLHQLNNKVGSIRVRVQGIEEKCADTLATSPYLANHLHEIEQSARQAMSIVQDSINFLRPSPRRPVNVSRCLKRALQQAALPPEITIKKVGFAGLPRVMAGEQQLDMVFYNLLDNAGRAMAGRGEIRLTAAYEGDEVAITVADSGPGIPPKRQAHVFNFTPAAGERLGQLGFGLWWVKTFVDRFGGRLHLVSEPGQGTAITFWLPVE